MQERSDGTTAAHGETMALKRVVYRFVSTRLNLVSLWAGQCKLSQDQSDSGYSNGTRGPCICGLASEI